MRALARKAGEGDLLAAERLVSALRRHGPGKLEVVVLTVVYDLDYVAFRSRDTMAESFVFASEGGAYAKMGTIIDRVIRYLADDERESIGERLRVEDYVGAVELYHESGFQPATFWWSKMLVED